MQFNWNGEKQVHRLQLALNTAMLLNNSDRKASPPLHSAGLATLENLFCSHRLSIEKHWQRHSEVAAQASAHISQYQVSAR